jgi:hypothetical protein
MRYKEIGGGGEATLEKNEETNREDYTSKN